MEAFNSPYDDFTFLDPVLTETPSSIALLSDEILERDMPVSPRSVETPKFSNIPIGSFTATPTPTHLHQGQQRAQPCSPTVNLEPTQLGEMIHNIQATIGQLNRALEDTGPVIGGECKGGGSRKRKAKEMDVDEISDDDERKRMQRKERNKASAQYSRDKKKSRMLYLESSVTLLSNNNTLLTSQLNHTAAENEALKERLRQAEALLYQHDIDTSILTHVPAVTTTTTTTTSTPPSPQPEVIPCAMNFTTNNVTNNFNAPGQHQTIGHTTAAAQPDTQHPQTQPQQPTTTTTTTSQVPTHPQTPGIHNVSTAMHHHQQFAKLQSTVNKHIPNFALTAPNGGGPILTLAVLFTFAVFFHLGTMGGNFGGMGMDAINNVNDWLPDFQYGAAQGARRHGRPMPANFKRDNPAARRLHQHTRTGQFRIPGVPTITPPLPPTDIPQPATGPRKNVYDDNDSDVTELDTELDTDSENEETDFETDNYSSDEESVRQAGQHPQGHETDEM